MTPEPMRVNWEIHKWHPSVNWEIQSVSTGRSTNDTRAAAADSDSTPTAGRRRPPRPAAGQRNFQISTLFRAAILIRAYSSAMITLRT